MHSLKNTVVAVGLLGLSFLFYQASSNNSEELTDLIPALEISEGLDEIQDLAASGLDAVQSKIDAMPDFMAPDLSQPKQLASDLANQLGGDIAEHASQFKSQADDFVDHASPPINVKFNGRSNWCDRFFVLWQFRSGDRSSLGFWNVPSARIPSLGLMVIGARVHRYSKLK
jgi:hypothetical protein